MPKEITVKMAKASDKDREAVIDFVCTMEAIAEYGASEGIDGKDWKPDEAELGIWLRDWFKKYGPSMNRVVWGFETLVNSACDQKSRVLEWKPEIKTALEAAGLS